MEFLVFHQPSRPEAVIWTKAEQLPPHVPSAASGRGSSSLKYTPVPSAHCGPGTSVNSAPTSLGIPSQAVMWYRVLFIFSPPYKKSAAHFRELRSQTLIPNKDFDQMVKVLVVDPSTMVIYPNGRIVANKTLHWIFPQIQFVAKSLKKGRVCIPFKYLSFRCHNSLLLSSPPPTFQTERGFPRPKSY